MEFLGEHRRCKVYWLDFFEKNFPDLPNENWLCFAMSENDPYQEPQKELISKFCKISIEKGIYEFKAFGSQSSKLDDFFVREVVEYDEKTNQDLHVMTTCHDDESLANAFWGCFYATCLPDEADYDNLKLVCTHFENIDKKAELKDYLERFNEGWLPEN